MRILILLFFISACGQVNQQSRNYYSGKSKVRHGIIPKTFTPKELKKKRAVLTYDEKKAQKGRGIYQTHCLECHGAGGVGDGLRAKEFNPAPANLVKTVQEVPQFKFFMSLSQWKGEMPGWKNMFSKKESENLVHYLKKLAKQK